MTNLNAICQNLALNNLPIPEYIPLAERTGKLPFTLQNDYLFKAVMQINKSGLRSLLCSLLHLASEDICSVKIENPIVIGSHIKNKTIILDVKILLNSSRIVNLEMQRSDEGDWPERSLVYLCKTFNSLKPGESYLNVLPTHHIGILDFTSTRLPDEFYAHYYLMNGKSYEIYSDRLCLSVLNLSHIQLATEEDKLFRLNQWAALFKAETWEEIKMLTNKNPDFESIADAVYFLTENRELIDVFLNYEARQAYTRQREKLIQEKDHTIREKDHTIQEQKLTIQERDHTIQEQELTIQEKELALQAQCARNAELEKTVAELKHAGSSKPWQKINFPAASSGVFAPASLILFAASCGELNPLFD